jgi:2-polyprenyl-3-methyl-5-hydroxy-6-metoxy-1,4-benzoquinol methylase
VNDLNSHDFASVLVRPGDSVLDVGAGTGTFARRLISQGCSVTAVDLDPGAFGGLEELGVTTVLCDVETSSFTATLGEERFDTVVLLDVLEHLRDPEPVLRACVGLLAPGGVVVVSIPNVSHADLRLSLLAGRFRYMTSGLLDRGHLRFFDREGIEQLAKSADLDIVDSFAVERKPGTTEIELPDQLPAGIVDYVDEDPDSRVYQWVMRLAPSGYLLRDDPPQLGLMKRYVEVDRALEDAASYARSLEEGLVDSESRLHGADAEIARLGREVAALASERVELVGASDQFQTRIAGLENELRARALVLDAVRNEVEAFRRETETLEDLLHAHQERLKELEPVAAADHVELVAIRKRVGYRAMDRIARNLRRFPAMFSVARAVARFIAGSA